MNAKILVPVLLLGALLLAGCTAPQESAGDDNTSTTTCPDDTGATNTSGDANASTNGTGTTYSGAGDDMCPDMTNTTP